MISPNNEGSANKKLSNSKLLTYFKQSPWMMHLKIGSIFGASRILRAHHALKLFNKLQKLICWLGLGCSATLAPPDHYFA